MNFPGKRLEKKLVAPSLIKSNFLAPNFAELVDRTFSLVFLIGKFAGARLLQKDGRRLEKFLFFFIVFVYFWGTFLILVLVVPIPINGSIDFQIDVYMAYPLIWGAFMLDGFACFITINYSTNYLINKSGFVNQCREVALVAQPSEKSFLHWRRSTVLITGLFCGLLLSQAAVSLSAAAGIVDTPVRIERIAYWTSVPLWIAWISLCTIAFMATSHISYHCIYFSNQIEITRIHMRTLNESLASEKAATMESTRLDLYHAEYCRIISMVQSLDQAFKESALCQLSLVTIGSSFVLYLFTQAADGWQKMIFVVFTLFAILFTFSFTVIPAILLDQQVKRPKTLLRSWFMKSVLHRNVYEGKIEREARSAFDSFMQSVASEDAGITIASLAKLNAQLLLTLGSVVLTYFLVILQFNQTQCNSSNSFANLTHFCMDIGFGPV